MSSLWEQRAARNEALFREVNENILSLEERYGNIASAPLFVCECATADCSERLEVSIDVYLDVRANPRRFLVVPGHEHSELEQRVGGTDTYLIVEKTGTAGEIAERSLR